MPDLKIKLFYSIIMNLCPASSSDHAWSQVSDCRSMPEFSTGSFGTIIDKGTMDAVLCANNGQQDTFRYLREVNRQEGMATEVRIRC